MSDGWPDDRTPVGNDMGKALFILNDPPYGTERSDILVGLAALFTWRVYTSRVLYGWM